MEVILGGTEGGGLLQVLQGLQKEILSCLVVFFVADLASLLDLVPPGGYACAGGRVQTPQKRQPTSSILRDGVMELCS